MSQQFPPDNGRPPYQPQQPGYPQQPYMSQQPGYPQQPPYMPPQQPAKPRAKWPFFVGGGCLVLLLATCGILAASGVFAAKSATVSTSQAVATIGTASTQLATVTVDTGSSSSANTGTIAKLGQTVTVNAYSATLVSVKALQADEFNAPKAGMQFIVVHVTLKNTGSSQVSYNPFDFHIKSSKGNVTDADFAQPASYTANNVLNSGNLDPGGSVDGDIIFQAPKGDTKAELTWETSIFSSNTQYGWTLGAY